MYRMEANNNVRRRADDSRKPVELIFSWVAHVARLSSFLIVGLWWEDAQKALTLLMFPFVGSIDSAKPITERGEMIFG